MTKLNVFGKHWSYRNDKIYEVTYFNNLNNYID